MENTLPARSCPLNQGGYNFEVNFELLEDKELRDFTLDELLATVPDDYGHPFVFVVVSFTIAHPELVILVVGLYESRGRSFRAIPSQIQRIENNLSIGKWTLMNLPMRWTRTESSEVFPALESPRR